VYGKKALSPRFQENLPLSKASIKNKKRKREEEEGEEEPFNPITKEIDFKGSVKIKKLTETAIRGRDNFHPLLPEIWFFCICIGPSECGKTTVLLNLLKSKAGYKKKFDRVFMFNPYAKTDPIYKQLKLDEDRVYTKWTEEELRGLLKDKQTWVNDWQAGEADIPPPTDLWVIDDSFGTDISSSFKQSVLDEIITVGRKLHINVWMIGHRWKRQISTMMRRQMTHGIFFEMPNRQEYENFRDEVCPPWLSKKDFDQMYTECTMKPKDFLYINFKAPRQLRFSHNFDRIFVTRITKDQENKKGKK